MASTHTRDLYTSAVSNKAIAETRRFSNAPQQANHGELPGAPLRPVAFVAVVELHPAARDALLHRPIFGYAKHLACLVGRRGKLLASVDPKLRLQVGHHRCERGGFTLGRSLVDLS